MPFCCQFWGGVYCFSQQERVRRVFRRYSGPVCFPKWLKKVPVTKSSKHSAKFQGFWSMYPFIRLVGGLEKRRRNGHHKTLELLVCVINMYQDNVTLSGKKRGSWYQGQSPPVLVSPQSPISLPFPPPTLNRLKGLVDSYWFPKHLCPPDCPLWIFPDLLASAG